MLRYLARHQQLLLRIPFRRLLTRRNDMARCRLLRDSGSEYLHRVELGGLLRGQQCIQILLPRHIRILQFASRITGQLSLYQFPTGILSLGHGGLWRGGLAVLSILGEKRAELCCWIQHHDPAPVPRYRYSESAACSKSIGSRFSKAPWYCLEIIKVLDD